VLTVLSNGQMLAAITVAPYPTNAGAFFHHKLVRLNNDGSLDPAFGSPVVAVSPAVASFATVDDPVTLNTADVAVFLPSINPGFDAVLLPDGKVLVAGSFAGGLARLQPNGAQDLSFPGGSGAALLSNPNITPRVERIVLDQAGKIWITGNFDTFNGVPVAGIARLQTNGTVDGTFS